MGFLQREWDFEGKEIICTHLSPKTTLIFLLQPLLSTLPRVLLLNLGRDLLGLKTCPLGILGLSSSNESLLALLLVSSLTVSIFTATGEAESITYVLWEGSAPNPLDEMVDALTGAK